MLANLTAISAQRIFEHVEKLAAIGPREDGTTANHLAVDYVADTLSSLGLKVQQQPVPCWVIEPIETSLQVISSQGMEVKCYHGNLSGVTVPEGVKGELVFVGSAFEEDFEGVDVSGKIVIACQDRYWDRGDKPAKKLLRAQERGAKGMLFAHKRRDDIITCWPLGREPAGIPFVSISYPDFLCLQGMMEEGPVEVVLKVLGAPKKGESPNIFTVIPGTELPDEVIGIGGSHHETVPMCPGANDNGVGQGMLLELARFFHGNPQKRSILLLANGGEEGGCWGTAAFVETNREWLDRSLKAMVMVDQMGAAEATIFSGGTLWLEKILIEEATKLGYRLPHCFDPLILPAPEFIGDPLPFVEAGFPTANIGGWPSDCFYHTPEDTPDKVCANGVKAVADIVASVVMRLASQ